MTGVPPSAVAPQPTPTAGVEDRAPRRRFRPRRWQLALAVLVILAAAAAAAETLSSSAAATPRVVPNSLVRLNPSNGKPTRVVPVGVEPGDLRTHTVDSRSGIPAQPDDIAVDGDGNAWITSSYEQHAPARNAFVTRLEAGTGGTSPGTVYPSHLRTIDLPLPMADYEALGAGYLWVIVGGHGPLPGDDRVALVDLRTNQVASVLQLHHSATSIAFGYGSAWIGTYTPGVNSWLEVIRAGDSKPTKVALQNYANWGLDLDRRRRGRSVGPRGLRALRNRPANAASPPPPRSLRRATRCLRGRRRCRLDDRRDRRERELRLEDRPTHGPDHPHHPARRPNKSHLRHGSNTQRRLGHYRQRLLRHHRPITMCGTAPPPVAPPRTER